MFDDHKPTNRYEAYNGNIVLASKPGFCNNQEQSFEETRRRRYELYNARSPETTGVFRDSTPQELFHSASSSEGLFQHSKKGMADEVGGNCVRQTLGSTVTADANIGEIPDSAKPQGEGTFNVATASSDTRNHHTASPHQNPCFSR